jgi:hypothetical protein
VVPKGFNPSAAQYHSFLLVPVPCFCNQKGKLYTSSISEHYIHIYISLKDAVTVKNFLLSVFSFRTLLIYFSFVLDDVL